jgi:hypothetical protein
VTFQLDTICGQDTDAAILQALEDLPKDLSETFNRILRKIYSSESAKDNFRTRIFELTAAAQRPLSLDELREAINVKVGQTVWNPNELINDLPKLLASCGSLLIVEEEHMTVRFAHHSIKQHILYRHAEPSIDSFFIDIQKANLRLGEICVTYLNFGMFETQLTKAKSSQTINYPSFVLNSTFPENSIAGRLALRFVKSRGESGYDVGRQLELTRERSMQQAQEHYSFLPYAREFWLFHTISLEPSRSGVYSLWHRLLTGSVTAVDLPWAPENWDKFGFEFIKWTVKNGHRALFNLIFERLEKVNYTAIARTIKRVLQEHGQELNMSSKYFGRAVSLALYNNDDSFAALLLENGADANAQDRYYGNVLQAASYKGYEGVVKLLLKRGADVHAQGGYYGNALQAASYMGQQKVVKLLLENGADVNLQGGRYGEAWWAAFGGGNTAIIKLLREKRSI